MFVFVERPTLLRRALPLCVLLALGCDPRGGSPAQATESRAEATAQPEPAPAPTPEVVARPGNAVPEEQRPLLKKWFDTVGQPKAGETFGELIVRAASLQLGVPYHDPPQKREPETIKIHLETFQCVSYVEQSIALARCIWMDTPNADCFVTEVEASRYRNGKRTDYASRLHYFTDWLQDNAKRGRLQEVGKDLDAKPLEFEFSFMTKRPHKYPGLADPTALEAMKNVEADLSATGPLLVDRDTITAVQNRIEPGDVVAIAGSKPGLLVMHAGFAYKNGRRSPQLLHASSHNNRVLLTKRDIRRYILDRPERRGVLVGRPVAPPRAVSTGE